MIYGIIRDLMIFPDDDIKSNSNQLSRIVMLSHFSNRVFSYFQLGLSGHGLSDIIETGWLGSVVTDCNPLMKLAFHNQRNLSEENQIKTFQLIWIQCCSEVVQKGPGGGKPLILWSHNCTQSLLILTLILHSQTHWYM